MSDKVNIKTLNGHALEDTQARTDLAALGERMTSAERKATATSETVVRLSEEIADLGGGASTPEQESAPLGAELASASGWTTDGWTGDFASGFTHIAGNTNPLIFTMPEATGTNLYLVQFTLDVDPELEGSFEGTSGKGIWVQIGNSEYFDLYNETSPHRVGIRSVSDGNLQFNPGTNYTGTISAISVKKITGVFPAPTSKKDSDGNVAYEVRPTIADKYNLFFGLESGQYNVSGHDNVGVGAESLESNTSGYRNVAVGHGALRDMTVGSRNVGIGHLALENLIEGQRNTGIGNAAANFLLHGQRNIAIGADSLYTVTDADDAIAIGYAAMYAASSGNVKNIAIGNKAGYSIAGNNTIAIGERSAIKVQGLHNIGIGYNTLLHHTTGDDNIAIGRAAGNGQAERTACDKNVFIGKEAGAAIGSNSSNNVFIGPQAGAALRTGSGNILIGNYAQAPDTTSYSWVNIGNLYQGSLAAGARYASIRGGLEVTELPTADPGIAGRFWNDGGTVKVSAG